MHAIEAVSLVKNYGKVRALDGLTLSVRSGTVFALLGPNGAGKSTTVKILTTLSRPDSGTVQVSGFDVLREPHRVRTVIGCVAQKPSVDLEATGLENVLLQGRLQGLSGSDLKARAAQLMERFSLAASANRIARTYSGGMQRKLDIAMALIHQPQVLFLDEPTTGLDPEARADLWREITRLASDGLTVLLTTHYLEEADQLAEHVAIVDKGRVVAEGAPETLKAELRGDALQIELTEAAEPQRVHSALERINSVRDIQVNRNLLHARADQGASAVPPILLALESADLRVLSVRVSRPSLDDVYLRYTGRTFQQAEGTQV